MLTFSSLLPEEEEEEEEESVEARARTVSENNRQQMVSHYALTSFFGHGEGEREGSEREWERERLHHKWSIVRYHLPEWDDDDDEEGERERRGDGFVVAAAATPLHPIYLSRAADGKKGK